MSRLLRPGCTVALGALAALALAVGVALPPRALRLDGPLRDSRVVRGSIHVHTSRSDGAGSVDDVARAARDAGLDFVVISDHGDATRAPDPPQYRSGVLCLDAVEISTTGGHYVALGLGRSPYRLAGEPRDVVEDVARLGGFGIAAHPASPKAELQWSAWETGLDGLEWLNADSEWRDESPPTLARAFATYWLRAPETIASLFDCERSVFDVWDRLTRERRVVGVAGHDAHARVGLSGNWEPEQDEVVLRLPGTRAPSVRSVSGRGSTGRSPVSPARTPHGSSTGSGPDTCSQWWTRSPDPPSCSSRRRGRRAPRKWGTPSRTPGRSTSRPGPRRPPASPWRSCGTGTSSRVRRARCSGSSTRAVSAGRCTVSRRRSRAVDVPACRGWWATRFTSACRPMPSPSARSPSRRSRG